LNNGLESLLPDSAEDVYKGDYNFPGTLESKVPDGSLLSKYYKQVLYSLPSPFSSIISISSGLVGDYDSY
jgi:hypothetical protein